MSGPKGHRNILMTYAAPIASSHMMCPPADTTSQLTREQLDRSQPEFVGLLLDWGLQGALCSQTYFYYTSFPKDVTALKIFVGALFLAEWVQTILATTGISGNLFAENDAVANILPLTVGVPVMSGIIAAAVQIFYAWRIFVLSVDKRSRYLAAAIALFDPQMSGSSIGTWLAITASVDILIAISMSILHVYALSLFIMPLQVVL
ncbi:predicted protein [Postia placenta Mad-698-R]|uniref:Uncharacterized protein n=1 Tax=Postia placenta MAD-698-R-SB12 TaxID=670580 RepID=A0A1X6MJ94_9APHY|nr:hypothetical protein POSPLADRAFT_1160030 [Postia placenta MAD-698-R-SB12]EED85508.1 predicted protein [Postia placenta Mad-698-R]OSX56418.1 hypothetical protein POSPLADRAFT_1160030 [Postia placenta MAD-698-R-SB12]